MKRFVTLVIALGFSCCLCAQTVDTTVCNILDNPQSFNGKIVRIKGTVYAGFDQFVVKGTDCGINVNKNIWLSYPEGIKAKAGPAVMVHLQPARNFAGDVPAAQRTAVELDKNNKDFKQFDSLLATPYKKGGMCLGCNRYEVTATLVGRLDAVANAAVPYDKAGKIAGFGGFGHMNAYSARLVLQAVSDVASTEVDYSKALAATKDDVATTTGDTDSLAAARKLAAAYKDGVPSGDQLKRAVGAFGKENEKNTGVVIVQGSGNVAAAKDEAKGAVDSPDGLLFTVTYNSNRVQGDAETRALVFAGENVANLRNPLPQGAGAGIFDLETRAWVTTVLDSFANKQKTLTLPGGHLVMNSAWPPDSINQQVDTAIEDFLGDEELLHR
ncbi:MAG: hypothetical protein ABSD72_13665 [Terracidiphilus sp.]|jgi:hypothetical protein